MESVAEAWFSPPCFLAKVLSSFGLRLLVHKISCPLSTRGKGVKNIKGSIWQSSEVLYEYK